MPSEKISYKDLKLNPLKLALALLCTTALMACGSGETTRKVAEQEEKPPSNITYTTLTAIIPVHVMNAKIDIRFINETEALYSKSDFTGFDTEAIKLNFDQNREKMVLVTVSGDKNTLMYDPALNKYVPFEGSIHAFSTLSSLNNQIYLTPASEAIYQRTLVRSNEFDFKNPDISLVKSKYFIKATTEINNSLNSAFLSNNYPRFSNLQSISVIRYNSNMLDRNYYNLFVGLGYLQYWAKEFTDTKNTYLEVSNNLAVDLRDGYLDGKALRGDNTPFHTVSPAPYNLKPENNTLLKIGDLQRQTRENFGNKLKLHTLEYATKVGFQNTYNPLGLKLLETEQYYTSNYVIENLSSYRWRGAGDYRPAIGLRNSESCGNGINPCRQGLNADDIETNVNDIEYLIGTHQLNQCVIKFYPSGDVSITRGDKIYRSSINRDLSDNLQQINNDPQNYILNVGASESKPAYFLQFEIKDLNIVKARTGYNNDIYPTSLDNPEMDCAL